MGEDTFQYDDRAVHNDTEVDGSEAHQVGGDIEKAHHDKGKEHRQRND